MHHPLLLRPYMYPSRYPRRRRAVGGTGVDEIWGNRLAMDVLTKRPGLAFDLVWFVQSEVANDSNGHVDTGTHDLTADSRLPTTLQLSAAGPGLHTWHASHAEAQTIMRQPEKLPRSRQGSLTQTPILTLTRTTAAITQPSKT
ncbi:hypothetical protein B0T13DRAFT_45685 [Neurospora crassa]|nr:hypothetical protein B0T13DRAFT_45685 [Neurospora crassa]